MFRRQKTLRARLPDRPPTHAAELLVESTSIKLLGEVEWKREKHGAKFRRKSRKARLGLGTHTLEVRAIGVNDNSVVDTPMSLS